MSKTVNITSAAHFSSLLQKSRIVVADFYADWCGPCHQIAPIYEQLSESLSRPGSVTFTKINTDEHKDVASAYSVASLPTFLLFRDGKIFEKVTGADPRKLQSVVKKLSAEVESVTAGGSGGEGSGGVAWRGAELPRSYGDVTDQIETPRLELLNIDTNSNNVKILFDQSRPSALAENGSKGNKDWVESDTDEQLMLFVPFNSMIKLHTVQITSLPPKSDDEAPMRPKLIKIFSNTPHNLGFDEAEDMVPTQEVDLTEGDWNENGTANIPLRFVKFQKITSLVFFVVSGDGDSEQVRLDRIRLVGETGEKREMGKLEKIGDEAGE